jgi:hypothetical protein
MNRIQITAPRYVVLALSLVSVAFAGCGSGQTVVDSQIRGKVTFQGAPVGEGTVSLVNEAGNAGGQAPLKSDGTFELDKRLPPGQYLVAVLPPMVEVPGTATTAPGKVTKEVANIPYHYRSSATSQIKVEVDGGESDLKIEMK